MDTPTYNAEGREVWKPQPGQFHQGGLRYVQSYGGIVSALQDIQVAKGMDTKAYPNNFAGIIAAIEDIEEFLVEGNLPDIGAPPPGWEIIINPDGSIDLHARSLSIDHPVTKERIKIIAPPPSKPQWNFALSD